MTASPVLPLCGLIVGTILVAASARGEVLLPGVMQGSLEEGLKGRALLEELNCVACHKSETLKQSSRRSPRLSQVGGRVHPDYLRAFLANPHLVKPGTPMPDLLEGRGNDERSEIAEALTHYLVSLNTGATFAPVFPDAVAAEQGEKLFHSVGCVACHSPRDPEGKELLAATSVPLGELEGKYSFASLTSFLRRPHSVRPGGRMPDLNLPGQEVDRIAHYLLKKTRVPGHLAFTTWRGNVWEGLEGAVTKERAGEVADFSPEKLGRIHHQTAVRYEGYLKGIKEGDFKFYFEANGGGVRLNGKDVIKEKPSNRRGVKKLQGVASLKMGWNHIEVTYFHTGRDPRFRLEMEGGEFPRGSIPSTMLSVSQQSISPFVPLEPQPNLVEAGRTHFESLGCAQCHDDIKVDHGEFTALAELSHVGGCLSEKGASPRFDLSEKQRLLLRDAILRLNAPPLDDQAIVNKTLATFNCIACHERKGLGGISPERNAYFTGTKEALGDQGRLPPPLTHVGAKLTKDWLSEVMVHGGRQRLYLNTRMPRFGGENVAHLVERFGKVDSLEEVSLPTVSNIRESKDAGYEMMGTQGLSCIACHDFNGQKSGGAGALELIHVTKRLQKNWFHLYMRQPSRFHPTVIMPSYWPGGVSVRKEVLDGSADLQIEALWNYLADGARAKNPKGLSRQSPELRVADETVMCRGRGTAGYRGIGVGYPERISLAFDSEEMALRMVWKGEFANIGHGRFHARGSDRISFPAGIPFHRLESMEDEWPYKGKTDYLFPQDHGYEYRGYVLNQDKRPRFRYRYGEVAVEDFFEDLLDQKGKAFFRRSMTFTTKVDQEMFFFRVGSGMSITKTGKEWKVDGLTLRLSGEGKALIREGEPQELLLPLTLPAGKTDIKVEYRW